MGDDTYSYRDKMLDDLIKNVTLKGLRKAELLDMPGPPTRTDADHKDKALVSKS